jgi:hypothetical protein
LHFGRPAVAPGIPPHDSRVEADDSDRFKESPALGGESRANPAGDGVGEEVFAKLVPDLPEHGGVHEVLGPYSHNPAAELLQEYRGLGSGHAQEEVGGVRRGRVSGAKRRKGRPKKLVHFDARLLLVTYHPCRDGDLGARRKRVDHEKGAIAPENVWESDAENMTDPQAVKFVALRLNVNQRERLRRA